MSRGVTRAWRRWAAHHRVHVTMLFALAYVAFSRPLPGRLLAGTVLVAAGQALRLWAAGHLRRNVELTRGGPYRWVRHPLYLGSFSIGTGLALAVDDALLWTAAFLVLFVACFWPAMHVEELRLLSLFGAEYQEYMVETPRLLPRLSRPPGPKAQHEPRRFSWQRARANRELRSAAAMGLLLLLQAIKLLV